MKRLFLIGLSITLSIALVITFTPLALAIGEVNLEGGPLKEDEFFANPPGKNEEDHSGVNTWISKWYGPGGNYTNNGGAGIIRTDLIDVGTNGELTQETLSTLAGLQKTKTINEIDWAGHGGAREWTGFELPVADDNNMDRGGPSDNIDIHGILVIDSPKAMTSVMSPAHDNNAQIWINGKKWYYYSVWTGGARKVHFNVEISLEKGVNVLLFRVTEVGGGAYMNLHFDDATHNAVKIYPDAANSKAEFLQEVAGILPVEPAGKLTTIWADIKRK